MNLEGFRERAIAMDENDPLAKFRNQFFISDPNDIYLDGNSLGRLPKRTANRIEQAVQSEWGTELIKSWNTCWYELPTVVAGKIAKLIGARPHEVLVADSTSVNLFKLVMAALKFQTGRKKIVSHSQNFPSDLYVLQGCCELTCNHEVLLHDNPVRFIDDDTALLTMSHTEFKNGRVHDMQRITQIAHENGALMLWDLSHSVGAIPINLNTCNVDLAVGCTYKFLNGGPGAPAFLYVREDLVEQLTSPIYGWFGQFEPFQFSTQYKPADGIQRFHAGTTPILSLAPIEAGVDLLLEAGMSELRIKSLALTDFFITMFDAFLANFGFTLCTPRAHESRGSHVALSHPHARAICQILIQKYGVIPDFRAPDVIRFGFAPIYNSFSDVHQAVTRLVELLQSNQYAAVEQDSAPVT